MKPVFNTNRFEVFRITCERSLKGAMPRDVYVAFFRDKDVPRPVCTMTVWPTAPVWDTDDGRAEPKGRFVEWCEVTEEFRRQGIATEVLLAVQEFAGPLDGIGVTDAGEALMEVIGDKLTGIQPVFRDDWLEKQGYDAGQRAEIHRECKLGLSRHGFSADFSDIFQRYEPNTSAREE
jgi:hypothetical protein